MTFAKDDLIAVLRLRYDYYSAGNVFDAARERASIADKASYEAADVRAIRAALPSVGDRLTAVLERFDELLGAAPAGKDAPKKEEKKADAPKAEVKAEKSDKTEKAPAPAEDKKADEAPKAEVKAEKSDKTEKAPADEKKDDDKKADAAS